MNELELLTRLRDEVPLAPPSPGAESLVLAGISSAGRADRRRTVPAGRVPGRGLWQHRGLRAGMAGLIAVGACAAGAVVVADTRGANPVPQRQTVAWSGRPTAPLDDARPSFGRASSEAQLVDYATRSAAASPGPAPAAHDWIFVRDEIAQSSAGSGGFLFGPPDERLICLQWVRADGLQDASGTCVRASLPASAQVHIKLTISPDGGGTIGGWKSVSYSYLNSLPTVPGQLEQVILADNIPGMPWYTTPDNVAIFNAIGNLLQAQTEGVWIPPKLAAALYQVLQRLPGVVFDSGTDLAGRTGIGLYMVIDGWYKQEFVINPLTYAYMGNETVATQAHTDVATDGTRYIKQGQVLGWQALLDSVVVQRPGQLP
jgi:hypothetical protein